MSAIVIAAIAILGLEAIRRSSQRAEALVPVRANDGRARQQRRR